MWFDNNNEWMKLDESLNGVHYITLWHFCYPDEVEICIIRYLSTTQERWRFTRWRDHREGNIAIWQATQINRHRSVQMCSNQYCWVWEGGEGNWSCRYVCVFFKYFFLLLLRNAIYLIVFIYKIIYLDWSAQFYVANTKQVRWIGGGVDTNRCLCCMCVRVYNRGTDNVIQQPPADHHFRSCSGGGPYSSDCSNNS